MGALLPVRCAPLVCGWVVAGLWLGCGRRGRCAWYGSTGAAAPSVWIGRRGLAATVRPSYCQRCPDSPTLNTPGSLPWPLSDVRRWVVGVAAVVMWPPVGRCGSWCGLVVYVAGCGFHRRGCSVSLGGRLGDVVAVGVAGLSMCPGVGFIGAAARCRWVAAVFLVWIGRCGCRFVAGLSMWIGGRRLVAVGSL